jgi:uncharacterized protein
MILKLLLVIAVITTVYFFFIKKKPSKESNKNSSQHSKEQQANEMVECARCGTYAELSESIISNNKYYCSRECVDNE